MDSSSLENASRLLVVSKSFMENAELGKMVQIPYSKEKKFTLLLSKNKMYGRPGSNP